LLNTLKPGLLNTLADAGRFPCLTWDK
jgi:hypothetical protein